MATLTSTRNMFNFVLTLYLLGFVAMVIRWQSVDLAEDGRSRERERRDERYVQSSSLHHLEIDVKALEEDVKHDVVLKVDEEMPILKNDIALESKEQPINKVKEQKSHTQTGSKTKSVKKGKKDGDIKKIPSKKKMSKAEDSQPAPAAKAAKAPVKNIKSAPRKKETVPVDKGKQLIKAEDNKPAPAAKGPAKNIKSTHERKKETVPANKDIQPIKENPIQNELMKQAAAQGPGEVLPVDGGGAQGKANQRKQTKGTPRRKPDEKTLWKAEQAKRKSTLREACKLLDNLGQPTNISEIIKSHKRMLWPIIVEDKYRLLYTFVSKVGSTNWKSAFLVLKGKYKTVEEVLGKFAHSPSLVKLSSLPDEGIQPRLDQYTNFIFVRHPFARVLSAYRSKFLQPNRAFQKGTGARIIRMYRKNATKEALQTGSDVTFPEFVQYLANAKTINFDGHWQPIYKMVLPCTIRFDYIGKLETGEVDAKYILQETHVDHLVHFKETKRNVSHDETIFSHFYSQIPSTELVKLYKVYEPDFKLFGYEIPDSMKDVIKVR